MVGPKHCPHIAALSLALVLGALSGCGSGGTSNPTPPLSKSRGNFRERPGQQATRQHLRTSDCQRLAHAVARQTGRPTVSSAEATPPNSRCQVSGRGILISITLDTADNARQRYENRMVEQVQFNAPDPAKVPHHVARVGDPGAGNHFASWIPTYSTLYAVRGNRWLTLSYAVASEPRRQRLLDAAALAREAFRLTAR